MALTGKTARRKRGESDRGRGRFKKNSAVNLFFFFNNSPLFIPPSISFFFPPGSLIIIPPVPSFSPFYNTRFQAAGVS